MHSGHLLALVTMMPLSMEKASDGSPLMDQSRIFTGSPSTLDSTKVSERGTESSPSRWIH
eukprot:754792-Hanusia_phi.AAC.1